MTTSLTWTFSACRNVVSCGIDSEQVARFRKWDNAGTDFLPFVFTKREHAHCRRMQSPARGLCAAFCVKEAMFKALGRPYNFTECEFFLAKSPDKSSFVVSRRFAAEAGNTIPRLTLMMPESHHFTAVVYLLGAA